MCFVSAQFHDKKSASRNQGPSKSPLVFFTQLCQIKVQNTYFASFSEMIIAKTPADVFLKSFRQLESYFVFEFHSNHKQEKNISVKVKKIA